MRAGTGTARLVAPPHGTTPVWCFNDRLPGPEIRVRQGECPRIVVDNALAVETTVHWHGLRLPNALVAAALAWGLGRDPRALPSARIGEPVPDFSLPPVQGRALGLSSEHLEGQVSLVNVFASWCIPCRAEHPILMRLANGGTVPVFGLNYKDKPAEAAVFLDQLGDPYARTGADLYGRVAIDWGVYGVPETYIVAPDGRIAYRHAGPLTQDLVFNQIFPLLSRLRAEPKE